MDINIEARRSLKICKLQLIAWDSSCVGPITAECSASSLTVVSRRADSEERATFELRFPDGYVFQEGTLSPIRTDQGVRRRGGAALEPCREVTFGGVPFDRTDAVGREANREPVPGVPYSVDCAQCSAPILRRGAVFRRVLPLPSEGWREAAGDWFCHDHGDPKNGGIPDVLAPKEDELFTSADRFLVHHSAVQDGVVANDGRLRCSVCQRVVGKKDSCAASALFTTRVQVASDAQSRVPCSAGDAAFVVSSLIRGQLLINTNCRIILESEGDRSLLLWLMETGLEHCAASGLQPGTTCRVQPKPVIKVLFHFGRLAELSPGQAYYRQTKISAFQWPKKDYKQVGPTVLRSREAGRVFCVCAVCQVSCASPLLGRCPRGTYLSQALRIPQTRTCL